MFAGEGQERYMDFEIMFNQGLNIIVVRMAGIAELLTVAKVHNAIVSSATEHPYAALLIDHTELDMEEFAFSAIRTIAEPVGMEGDLFRNRLCAHVIPAAGRTGAMVGYFQGLTTRNAGMCQQLFHAEEEAIEWLSSAKAGCGR